MVTDVGYIPFNARLDDLLETTGRVPNARRKSLYGETIHDPSKIEKNVERYTFYSTDIDGLKTTSLEAMTDSLITHSSGPKQLSDILTETNNWWINVLAPTDSEISSLSKAQESREKYEIFSNYTFISFRTFDDDFNGSSYVEPINFYILLFKNGVITFHFQPVSHPDNVQKRIQSLKDFIHVTPEWINYALLDDITDSFLPLIRRTEVEVETIDDLSIVLGGSEKADMLLRISSCRKSVMGISRLLGPKVDILRSLIKRYKDKSDNYRSDRQAGLEAGEARMYQEVLLYFGDIQDHLLTMTQNVGHFDLTLGRAHRNYLGQISIELSQAGEATSAVINRLTFLATIAVPLNLVAGIFGMNIRVPGGNNNDLVWFYWVIISMILFSLVMIAYGKRMRLL
ncbi:hypothetical protein BDF14DRAFT_1726026 [Spinellus fusiger]|nr:hypothetical protein BDF14DRAFT_1726026 [Spinellus fusiger]